MTKQKMIELAAKRAGLGAIPTAKIDELTEDYDSILRELLTRRKWLFSFDVIPKTAIIKTDTNRDIGFKNQYLLPSNVIKPLDVSNGINLTRPLTVDQGLSVGLAIDPDYVWGSDTRPRYAWVDRVLHTDVEPESILCQIDTTSFDENFEQCVIYSFAEFLAISIKHDERLAGSMARKAKDQLLMAISNNDNPIDPYYKSIKGWLLKFYRGNYY